MNGEDGVFAFWHGDVVGVANRIDWVAHVNHWRVLVNDRGVGAVAVVFAIAGQGGAQREFLVVFVHAIGNGGGFHQNVIGAGSQRNRAGVHGPGFTAIQAVAVLAFAVVAWAQGSAVGQGQCQGAAGGGFFNVNGEDGVFAFGDSDVVGVAGGSAWITNGDRGCFNRWLWWQNNLGFRLRERCVFWHGQVRSRAVCTKIKADWRYVFGDTEQTNESSAFALCTGTIQARGSGFKFI